MKRRDFLQGMAGASMLPLLGGAAGPLWAGAGKAGQGWRLFEITYEIELVGDSGSADLWVPLPQTAGGYQQAFSTDWSGVTAKGNVVREPTYGAPIFHASWPDGAERKLRLSSRVATVDRQNVPETARSGGSVDPDVGFYLKPTPSMPNDGIVLETARQVTQGARTPVDKARAIYEWVVDNTFRDPKVLGCGTGDIKFMLESGNFGGKCADINSLFVGLARAVGVPAREVYGIRIADSSQFKSLGKSGDISRAQHCRAEFYAAPWGWIPVDPADVRKVVLEENLPLTDPRVVSLRKQLFGAWEMNWIGFNSARDLQLTPEVGQSVGYLMYPNARTPHGHREGLVPEKFVYKITSRELKA